MTNFWGAINTIRREATKLRTDPYSAGCFTAQEAAMDMDRAADVLEAAGKVDKKRAMKCWAFSTIAADDDGGLLELIEALPDKEKK